MGGGHGRTRVGGRGCRSWRTDSVAPGRSGTQTTGSTHRPVPRGAPASPRCPLGTRGRGGASGCCFRTSAPCPDHLLSPRPLMELSVAPMHCGPPSETGSWPNGSPVPAWWEGCPGPQHSAAGRTGRRGHGRGGYSRTTFIRYQTLIEIFYLYRRQWTRKGQTEVKGRLSNGLKVVYLVSFLVTTPASLSCRHLLIICTPTCNHAKCHLAFLNCVFALKPAILCPTRKAKKRALLFGLPRLEHFWRCSLNTKLAIASRWLLTTSRKKKNHTHFWLIVNQCSETSNILSIIQACA